MEIKQKLINKDRYSIKATHPMKAEFIVIHNTANDATAKNEIAYMQRNNNYTSFHIAVDDKEAIQAIPFNRNSWAEGDGSTGRGNRRGISIEICYSKGGGAKFDKAEANAAKVVAQILKQYNWGIDKIKKHQDFSNKYCPHRTLDRGWQRFLNIVAKELGISTSSPSATRQPPISKPSKAILTVDGYWGHATTRELQKQLSTTIDGVISGQYSNSVTRAIPSASFTTRTGSNAIKALQRKINVKADGYIGTNTVKAMQKYLGTGVDGVISRPSNMVKELQRRLNKGKF